MSRAYMVEQKAVMRSIPIHQKFKVRKAGKVLRFVLALLEDWKWIEEDHDMTFTTLRIHGPDVIAALYKSHYEVMRQWNKSGQHLIIGAGDYAKLMAAPQIQQLLDFPVEAEVMRGGHRRIMGLNVTIVPWMEGMVILP